MPRRSRQPSESGYYHVTMRGVGKRCIFESDADRCFFLSRLQSASSQCGVGIVAWVLMSNHFHILIQCELDDMKVLMRKLGTSYAQYFNGVHSHVGHVFQGRYFSMPVERDEQLLATIRYIHLNPLDAGVDDIARYEWSSYQQYLGHEGICNAHEAIALLGTPSNVRRFHEAACSDCLVSLDGYRPRLDDAEALELVRNRFGTAFLNAVTHMERPERDQALRRMHALGLSGSQITRLTGLGRGIIQRACRKDDE